MTQAALRLLRQHGLVEMSPTGEWKPTRKGDELLDALDLLAELNGKRRPAGEAPARGMMNGRARAGRRRQEAT